VHKNELLQVTQCAEHAVHEELDKKYPALQDVHTEELLQAEQPVRQAAQIEPEM